MLWFINCDAKKLNKYEDDKLILAALKDLNSTKSEYDAACYLLESNDENVLNLPQYRTARSYLESLINYLKNCRDIVKAEKESLEKECNDMELNKKYFEILSCDEPFVQNIDEFIDLLNKRDVHDFEKAEILFDIIKSNVSNYKKEN